MRARWVTAGGLAAALGLLAAPSAHACSVCGCGDPLVAAADASPSSGEFRFAFDWEYLTARATSDEDPSATEELTQMSFRPELVWSPISELNLVLKVPLVSKRWNLEGPDGTEGATPFGLGDVELGARYFVLERSDLASQSRQELAFTAGTSLPTGPDDVTDETGARIDDHAQLGTGAFGPYLGALYAFHRDPWNVTATVTGWTHTRNRYGYRYGSAVLWSVTGLYRAWDPVGFELALDGRYAARDTVEGEDQVNTGGALLALTPGIRWNAVGNLWLHARAQVPIATALYGKQRVGPTFTVGMQYAFQ